MLAECSGVGMAIDVRNVPAPEGVDPARWLLSFPSFGYLLSVAPADVPAVTALFKARGIACADIGAVTSDRRVTITDGRTSETIWDFAESPLLACGPAISGAEAAA